MTLASIPTVNVIPAATKEIAILASIPHSGTFIPQDMRASYTERHINWLKNTDWFLPSVYAFLPEMGITTIVATHSRYVVDVNRNPEHPQFGPFFSAVVASHTDTGEPIYKALPPDAEAIRRVGEFHAPYHSELERQIARLGRQFARVLLLDLHSFMGPTVNDICLGNLRNESTRPETFARAVQAFSSAGFSVGQNDPFAGGYIVRRHHALPSVEALLIELRYPNYIECSAIDDPTPPEFDALLVQAASRKIFMALNIFLGTGASDA